MTVIQGNITDVGGAHPTGHIQIRALEPRRNEENTATVGKGLYKIAVIDGVITPTDVDPGPAVIQLSVGTWQHHYPNVVIPDEASIDFWDLVENFISYEPAVVTTVAADRRAAERARDEAVAAAESVEFVPDAVTQIAADRQHVDEVATSIDADLVAIEAAKTAALGAKQDAEAARDESQQTVTTNAGLRDEIMAGLTQYGAEIEEYRNESIQAVSDATSQADRAQSIADAVEAGAFPAATTTAKGGIILAGDLGGTYDAPTVPGLADKLNQAQVDARVAIGTAALVDAAPGTLDTLNELAAALGDDPNFAATIATQLGQKANLVHTHVIADVTGLQAALDAKGTSNLTLGTTSSTAMRGDGIQKVSSLPGSPVAGVLYCIPE